MQRRRFAAGDTFDDFQDDAKVSLLKKEDRVELGECNNVPGWAGKVEGLNYQISRVESRVSELNSLHVSHLSRPGMEEGGELEERIAQMTADMTKQFSECNKQLAALQRHSATLAGSQKRVLTNIVTNLVTRLQEITGDFRLSQGNYLRKVEAREQRNNQYFTSFTQDDEDDGLLILDTGPGSGWHKQDMLQMEENSKFLRKREQEISSIVQSIQDLNTIFKDLASMVSEQGEIVDRIDYNIENASIKVEHGLEELKKASKYQKSNRKMKCILVLGISLIILIFLLIITKT